MEAVRGMVWIFYGIAQFYTHPFTCKIECILEKKDIFVIHTRKIHEATYTYIKWCAFAVNSIIHVIEF